jgi:hypothetical protein
MTREANTTTQVKRSDSPGRSAHLTIMQMCEYRANNDSIRIGRLLILDLWSEEAGDQDLETPTNQPTNRERGEKRETGFIMERTIRNLT